MLPNLPLWMTYFVLGSLFLISLISLAGLYLALRKVDVSRKRKIIAAFNATTILFGWFLVSIILAKRCIFCADPDKIPTVPIGVIISLIIGFILLRVTLYQKILNAMPAHWLLAFQFSRIIGFIFLILLEQDMLPANFALAIGIGDILIGITAPFVAYWYFKEKPWGRTVAILWNIAGMLDIAFSSYLASSNMTSIFRPVSPPPNVDIVTHYPLVLLPIFGMANVVFVHLNSTWHLLSSKSVHRYTATEQTS